VSYKNNQNTGEKGGIASREMDERVPAQGRIVKKKVEKRVQRNRMGERPVRLREQAKKEPERQSGGWPGKKGTPKNHEW